MSTRVYLSAPDIGALEERYVVDAIRSGWVAPVGPDVDAFEQEVAAVTGTRYAVGLSSGTAGLHLALLGLGVRSGQIVIVPTLTFVATANAVCYTGAEPYFVDCLSSTGNIDVSLLSDVLAALRRSGQPVGAVVPVDLFGTCADYDTLLPLCAAAGVPVVEDAAEALGAEYGGRRAGSFGRAGIFSFNGNKIITTSGGGMLCTDDARLAQGCRYLATQARQATIHYEHTDVGFNYRLSNVLAALGRAQLARLPELVARRRTVRERYAKLFAGVDGVRLLGDDSVESNCWLTAIVVEPSVAGWTAASLGAHLTHADIETRPIWKPMHRQPVFTDCRSALSGVADELFANGLTLPSGSALTEAQVGRVLDAIGDFLERPR
jgi:dTDP-4-amino-4,6-dideoxygalactose transaminase